jgi:hypothetical protein
MFENIMCEKAIRLMNYVNEALVQPRPQESSPGERGWLSCRRQK